MINNEFEVRPEILALARYQESSTVAFLVTISVGPWARQMIRQDDSSDDQSELGLDSKFTLGILIRKLTFQLDLNLVFFAAPFGSI